MWGIPTDMADNFREFFSDWEHSESGLVGFYLHHKHMPIKEIAQKTGKSVADVYRTLRKFGHEPNRLRSGHPHVKTFLSSGMSVRDISHLTGYTRRNIRYLRRKFEEEK
jgi:transposase-like protein